MAWVAFDRAIAMAERDHGLTDAPLDRWRDIRDRDPRPGLPQRVRRRAQHVHAVPTARTHVDASLLMLPLVGFLPADDPRMRRHRAGDRARADARRLRAAVSAIRGSRRRRPARGEGVFLPCTFWLADNYALQGRARRGATTLFERLLALRNDVGLLSEEYDPEQQRLVGNFPQAFSHVALVNTARNLLPPRRTRGGSAASTPNGEDVIRDPFPLVAVLIHHGRS